MARIAPDLITEDENNSSRSTAGRNILSDTHGDRSATNHSDTRTHSDVNGGLGTPGERIKKTEKKSTPKDEMTKDRKKNMMYKWSEGLALFYPELPWVSIAC
jgi:hypothetical protein